LEHPQVSFEILREKNRVEFTISGNIFERQVIDSEITKIRLISCDFLIPECREEIITPWEVYEMCESMPAS